MAEPPAHVPPFRAYSINFNGLKSKNKTMRQKLNWMFRVLVRQCKADMVCIQETRFQDVVDLKNAFFPYKGQLRGFCPSPTRSKGTVIYIPPKSSLYGLVDDVEISPDGRWSVVSITAREEVQHVLNMYAPSRGKRQREEYYETLTGRFSHLPKLMAVGDWNFAPSHLDKVTLTGHDNPQPHPRAVEFFEESDLVDLFRYTWPEDVTMTFRHRNTSLGWARLDRWYVQPDMLDHTEPLDMVAAAGVSDHDAVGIAYGTFDAPIKRKHRPYRMSRSLIHQLGRKGSTVRVRTEEILAEAYEDMEEYGVPPAAAWDRCKACLLALYRQSDERHAQRMRDKMRNAVDLLKFGSNQDHHPDPSHPQSAAGLLRAKQAAEEHLKTVHRQDIQNAKCRSSFYQLRDGEHCNKLFFASVSGVRSGSKLPYIKSGDQVACTHEENKAMIAASFAETFCTREPDPVALRQVVDNIEGTDRCLTEAQAAELEAAMELPELTDEQREAGVKDWLQVAIEGLKMYKAPGSDGIPNEFYYLLKDNIYMTGMLKAVFKSAVSGGSPLPSSMNSTHYRLLYKKGSLTAQQIASGALNDTDADPRQLGNWRPIALLCCDFKILSSYMASKLKHHMGALVNRAQSAFIPGRSIHDNIMVIQQLIHRCNAEKIPAGLLFVDAAHAYDYLSQEFLLAVLKAMKFPPLLMRAIELQMSSQVGQVMVNGDLTEPFPVTNGGKQGDPLFPLLFIIAMEGLFASLDIKRQSGEYAGAPTPDPERPFMYAGYADDTVMGIGHGDDVQVIEQVLALFERASGMEVKPSKSWVIWLGPWKPKTDTVYGCSPTLLPIRYLGILVGHTVTADQHWQQLVDSLSLTALTWRSLDLSVFGRVLLLNSCLISKLVHKVMQVPLTTAFRKDIRKRINAYFQRDRKSTTVSWAQRTLPKQFGGLGQLDIDTHVGLLQAKWHMRYLAGDGGLWSVFWKHNLGLLSEQLRTSTQLEVLDRNWNTVHATKKGKVHPMVVASLRAWHSLSLSLSCEQDGSALRFTSVASASLYDNKFLLNSPAHPSRPNQSVSPKPAVVPALGHFRQFSAGLTVGSLFTPRTPCPAADFSYSDPDTWRYRLLSPAELSAQSGLNLGPAVWREILAQIPKAARGVMAAGPAEAAPTGWLATVMKGPTLRFCEEGRVEAASEGAWQQLGYGAEGDLVGKQLAGEVVLTADRDRVRDAMIEVQGGGQSKAFRLGLVCADQSVCKILVRVRLIMGDDGGVVGAEFEQVADTLAAFSPGTSDDNIGDVYYLSGSGSSAVLYWFEREEVLASTVSLVYGGNSLEGDWGDWREWLENMDPVAVSLTTGAPVLRGWAECTPALDNFTVKYGQFPAGAAFGTRRAEDQRTLEHLAASSFYAALGSGSSEDSDSQSANVAVLHARKPYYKPTYNAAFKRLRYAVAAPLPILSRWLPALYDRRRTALLVAQGDLPPTAIPRVHWKSRLTSIHNCPFVKPRVSELLYRLTTDRLMSGLKLSRIGRDGNCPFCQIPASPEHMFRDCPSVVEVWGHLDVMGATFWPQYECFDYNDIPTLLCEYDPCSLFKIAGLWALWRQWCDLFYNREQFDQDRLGEWLPECMRMVKMDLLSKLREAQPMIDWLGVLADRRAPQNLSLDGEAGPTGGIPEKLFLLTEAVSVHTNPMHLSEPVHPAMLRWIGNSVMCYRRGDKLVFNHAEWLQFEPSPPTPEPCSSDSEGEGSDEGGWAQGAAILMHDY